MAPRWSANGAAVPVALTKTQPCQTSTGNGTSPCSSGTNDSFSRKPGAARSDPSSPNVQAW